jgi:quercetin dioxygenase-like cupin family protein
MHYFCDLEDRPAKEIAPGARIRTFWGERMLLSRLDVAAHADVHTHSHPHEQAGILLSGELEVTIGPETRQLKAGDMFIVPGGVEHGVRTGERPAKILAVFSPVREEYQY